MVRQCRRFSRAGSYEDKPDSMHKLDHRMWQLKEQTVEHIFKFYRTSSKAAKVHSIYHFAYKYIRSLK